MNKQAGIYRAQLDFEKGFVRAPNEWLRDPALTLKAKGLLIYFLSHEIGYVITLAQIERETADGRAAIRSAIAELIEAGYLETDMTKDERGYNAGLAYTLKNPKCENPTLENPTLENRTAYRKQPLREDKEIKNYGHSKNDLEEFELFWKQYPVKAKKPRAVKAFEVARRSIGLGALLAALEAYKLDLRRTGYKPAHASTWLNDSRWNDEPTPMEYYSPEGRKELAGEISERQSEASRESARRALAEAEAAEAYARANPAPRCEHNRVAVICDTCNKKTATIKEQQLEG